MRRLIFLVTLVVVAMVLAGLVGPQQTSKSYLPPKGCEPWPLGKQGVKVMWPPNVLTIVRTGEKSAIVIAKWKAQKSAYYFNATLIKYERQDTCPAPCLTLGIASVIMQRPHAVPTSMPQDTPAVKVSVPPDRLDVTYAEGTGYAVHGEWDGSGKEGKVRISLNRGVPSTYAESDFCPCPCLFPSRVILEKAR
jgi:hypothetical protein